MLFREHPRPRIVRIFAGLVIMGIGGAMLACQGVSILPFSLMLIVIGLSTATRQATLAWREREDPYDLSTLWDTPPVVYLPEEVDEPPRPLVYCHRCGASMPEAYGLCPGCGTYLGT